MDDVIEQRTPQQLSEAAELTKAFNEVFALASGKRVLFWMLEQCSIYQDAFAGEQTHATSHTLGEQNAGRKLIAKLDEIDPRFYPRLLIDVADLKAMDRAAAAAKSKKEDVDEE